MQADRREFVKAGAAALTANIFTGRLRGANDRVNTAFIGLGKMGRGNLNFAMRQETVQVHSVCDVFERNLKMAHEQAMKKFPEAKAIKDFREVLADKSVDAVCISTPDHWHAYMTVEACKAGKDVYVEKPVSATVDEARKMVEAARKYNRVVQAGTMQRSGDHFQKAVEIVKTGGIGQVTRVSTWNVSLSPVEGIGNTADAPVPEGLDWDMWLGPAPKRPFNANRLGIDPADRWYSHFRWFWDYAGGMMTDWGVHLLDIVQMAFDEQMPKSVACFGEKFRLKDNRETPDTIVALYEYPQFIATYENRYGGTNLPNGRPYGILFHGDKGTLFVDRSLYQLTPEGRDAKPIEVRSSNNSNVAHWANFIDCMRSRQKPRSDIENCARSTATCLLANVSLRSKMRVDWDEPKWTVKQAEARKFLSKEDRKPWRIVI